MQSDTSGKRYVAWVTNIAVCFLFFMVGCLMSLFTYFNIIMILLGITLGVSVTIWLRKVNNKTRIRWPYIATMFFFTYFTGLILFTILLRSTLLGLRFA